MFDFGNACRKTMVTMVSASLLLSGCVTTQSERIGEDDGSDVCRANVVALDATGDYFAGDMIAGATIGAVAGGLIGALTSNSKDMAKNAAIGIAAGAAVGAAGGYMKSKMEQQHDKATLYQSVLTDYEKELAKADEANLAFKKLVDCRNNIMRKVVADYKAGQISRDEARLRWRRVLDQKANDLKIADAMGKNMSSRMAEFDNASTQMATMPWDQKQEAAFKQQTAAVEATYVADTNALKQQEEAAAKERDAAKKKQLKAEHDLRVKQAKAKHDAAIAKLQTEKAGKLPTATAQTRYQGTVQTAHAEVQKQVAVAENPDGFESALPGAKTGALDGDVLRAPVWSRQG
ncbi:MAG: hypothetical protein HQL37_11490 [Alphaproteobacteria bacterium]|nr:hypothetical protein [Alphaproteobacteria bacterium]